MITNVRRAPALALSDVLLPLHRAWWALLGVPMLATLHWLVAMLSAYPIALAIGPFGLAVVAMTVVVRVVLLPLAAYQLRAAIRARREAAELEARLAPQIEALRRRHRRRPERAEREIAELRRRTAPPLPRGLGVGFVTAAVQAPLLIAFYWVVLTLAHGTGLPLHFLWVANLALPDPVLLPVLTGLTTLLTTRLAAAGPPPASPAYEQSAQLQRTAAWFSPFGLAAAAHFAPAALVLYWVTGNLVGAAQQWTTNRILRSALAATSAS